MAIPAKILCPRKQMQVTDLELWWSMEPRKARAAWHPVPGREIQPGQRQMKEAVRISLMWQAARAARRMTYIYGLCKALRKAASIERPRSHQHHHHHTNSTSSGSSSSTTTTTANLHSRKTASAHNVSTSRGGHV